LTLPPLHPLIVHAPIALINLSLVFELAGRALDSAWWRKAALALLVIGVVGAIAAVITGNEAGEHAEHQGVPEQVVDQHGDAGRVTMWFGLGALLAYAIATRAGRARGAVALLALGLQVMAAISVGIAGYRGGRMVYEHGAGVRVRGQLVPSDRPPQPERARDKD